ncbi:type IV secretion protein Rhs [Propionibacterium sp. NM47_B9-13]|nr:type IV secretion protein Rhs [Cutibacterium modestum]EFS73500.1 RHS repeat-associated core domain protein [Cutibacterium modestum HL037PA2]EFS92292.1 RHS repeat-associated core domain protein [Cutibacterium modestum HL044PA1]EFT14253.1 RHS repeat-associated core domain protein [Cutibacterium modestum HL037PA3]TGY28907.1 type IV secretion protein Rhs [Propionibacterium sp. NM47_B9-13]
MTYDSFGNMVRCVDRAGNVTSHRYDQRGRLTHTDLPTGGTIDCSWDDLDRLVSTTLANGARTTLDYDSTNRDPVRVTDPCGGVTCLEWKDGLLLRATNPVGVSLRFSYDHHADLVSIENAHGEASHLIRDDAGRIVETISPGGVTTRFGYDDAGHLATVVTPDGATWAHRHDVAGRLIELVAPDSGVTKWEYRPDGQIARVIDPLGRVIERSYDDLGNVAGMQLPDGSAWGFAYDALSRLTHVMAPDAAQWTYAYDVDGNLSGVTDPAGFTRLFTDGLTASITSDGHGRQLHRVDVDPYGLPAAVTDVTGAQQIVTRDLCGRPVEFQDESGAVTHVERDLAGRIVALVSPTGLRTSYSYDACGRMVDVTDPVGRVTRYSYTPDFQVATVTDPTGETARYEYDVMGRVVLSHVPGAGVSQYRYDPCGRLVFSCDLVHGPRHFSYDRAGQLVTATNPAGGVSRYDYDRCGRLVTRTDPTGGLTMYRHDECGRMISVIDPLGRVTEYTWDKTGDLAAITRPDGTVVSHRLSPKGVEEYIDDQLVSRTLVTSTTRTVTIDDYTNPTSPWRHLFEYDPRGLLLTHNIVPVPGNESIVDEEPITSSEQWWYDAEGRRVRHLTLTGDSIDYAYTNTGELGSIRHSRLGEVSLEWDAAGRLAKLGSPLGQQQWGYTNGFVTSHTSSRGSTTISRDEMGRVLQVNAPHGDFRYGYDDSGSLTSADGPDGSSRRWVYDTAGRLVTTTCQDAGTSQTCHYDYDLAGELVARVMQLEPSDSTVETYYRYDPCGRRTEAASSAGMREEFRWDSRGWLAGVRIVDPTRSQEFITHVDTFGCLTDVSSPTGRTPITWDLAADEPGLVQVGGISALPLPDGGVLTPLSADSDQARPWRQPAINPLDPYTLIQEPLTADVSMAGGHLGVADLVWMGARVYDSATASFLTTDPLAAPPGSLWEATSYGYAATNPLALADPLGLRPVTDAQMRQFAGTIDTRNLWDRHIRNVFSWETLGGVGLATIGGALMCFGAEVPGAMLIGAGGNMVFQQVVHGHVDYGEVALSGALAPVGGSGLSEIAGLGTRTLLTRGIEAGATQVYVMGNYHWATSPGPHNAETYLEQVGGETLSGAVFGGITATMGGKAYDALPDSIPTGHFGPITQSLGLGKSQHPSSHGTIEMAS